MSWFNYGLNTKENGIGVWLRPQSNPDVTKLIKKSGNKRFHESVSRIIVAEYNEQLNMVQLEIWCKSIFDSIRKKYRYNVFSIPVTPNPYWVCEGDLGKGNIN